MFQWINSSNLSIWGWNLSFSLDYIVKSILQLKIFKTLQNRVINFKTISKLNKFWCRSILSQDVYQISRESNKIKGVTSRRRPHICKWAFLQVLWFWSTLPLIMRIVNGKIKLDDIKQKILIRDPTLDFNKRLNMQSLNKKYCKHFQKIMILKSSKKKTL